MKITGLFYLYFLLIIVNFSQALRCGKKFNNKKCPEKQCCSYLGYCGRSREYCDISYGCQSDFGRCNGKDSSNTTITTTTNTTTTITPEPTSSTVINCGPKYGYKTCPDNACCSASGQCGLDLESCGAGCQSRYGFCLPEKEFDKENCLECEDCFDCDDSPIDKLFCSETCFKDGNKRIGTIEVEPCSGLDNETRNKNHINPEDLCNECNKCIDCTQFPEVAKYKPNACIRASTNVSTDGTCGPEHDNKVCPNNQCCDKTGHCGTTEETCGRDCQVGYGNCLPQYARVCVTCYQCYYCDNEFDSLYCPTTCIKDEIKISSHRIEYKLDKYEMKIDCPKINKLCYEKSSIGSVAFYKVN